jgi:RNA polymerase-binding transcription factor DksA
MAIKRSELENIKHNLEDRKFDLQGIKDSIVELIKEYSEDIKRVEAMIDQDVLDTIKSTQSKLIDPKYCTHVNKKVSDHNNAETVTCSDCGLMLSFKVIEKK